MAESKSDNSKMCSVYIASVYVFDMLNLGSFLISDLAITDFFMHSL